MVILVKSKIQKFAMYGFFYQLLWLIIKPKCLLSEEVVLISKVILYSKTRFGNDLMCCLGKGD